MHLYENNAPMSVIELTLRRLDRFGNLGCEDPPLDLVMPMRILVAGTVDLELGNGASVPKHFQSHARSWHVDCADADLLDQHAEEHLAIAIARRFRVP